MSKKRWRTDEDEYLKAHYGQYSIEVITEHLKRSVYSVRWRASSLGLAEKMEHKAWSREEIKFLSENHASNSYDQLASLLGRTVSSVAHKLSDLKITRTYIEQGGEDDDIADDIPYRKGKSNEYLQKLAKMQIGQSFPFPHSEYQIVINMAKYFPERHYRTRLEEDSNDIRRVWRLL